MTLISFGECLALQKADGAAGKVKGLVAKGFSGEEEHDQKDSKLQPKVGVRSSYFVVSKYSWVLQNDRI